MYLKDQIPSKEIKLFPWPNDIQVITIEINFRKCKWLLLPIYKQSSQNEGYCMNQIEKYRTHYDTKTV